MEILGLDQATACGWAVVKNGSVLAAGVWHLDDRGRTGESRGMRYVRFRRHLEDTLAIYPGIRLVCHEQTLLRGGAATEIADGLKALILETAAKRQLDVTCVHPSELKKWATGSGRAEKPAMVAACVRKTGRLPIDDNEADATLIALWAAEHFG